jgi:hypothetical protein
MRRPPGIAGATLIYGQGAQFPDMILALQFLLDDLRRDGRQVSGVRLSGHTLRLRVEDFELAASLASEPLPVAAFHGVQRPAHGDAGCSDWTHDLARGRLLHAIRHHRCALGVLLRARCGSEIGNAYEELDLSSECRNVIAALVEASPPQFILWQASGVLFTLAEFRNLAPRRLNAPGDPATVMQPNPAPIAAVRRPTMPDWTRPSERPAAADVSRSHRPAEQARGGVNLPATTGGRELRRNRLDRVLRRSAGKLFRRSDNLQRPANLPGLERSHRRLARAFDREPAEAAARASKRMSRRRRLLGCALLAISLVVVPPWAGV